MLFSQRHKELIYLLFISDNRFSKAVTCGKGQRRDVAVKLQQWFVLPSLRLDDRGEDTWRRLPHQWLVKAETDWMPTMPADLLLTSTEEAGLEWASWEGAI